jgi:(2Fe-2S) ferredoxin
MEILDEPIEKIEVHAFVCTNERPAPKIACHSVGGFEFFSKLKEKLKAEGIYSTHKVTRSGCLGTCPGTGCTIAIYRKNGPAQWFTEVKPEDFDTIYNSIKG